MYPDPPEVVLGAEGVAEVVEEGLVESGMALRSFVRWAHWGEIEGAGDCLLYPSLLVW